MIGLRNRATLSHAGFPLRSLGVGRATAVYVLTQFWYVPIPSIGTVAVPNTLDPDWSSQPLSVEDAAHYVIGARSGMKVPLHDQKLGPHGIDSRRHAGNVVRIHEEEW